MESGLQLWCTIICACTLATVYTLVCSDISIVLSEWFVMYYVARYPARMWHGAYDQEMAEQYIDEHKPLVVIGSPPCTPFSQLQTFSPDNTNKREKLAEGIRQMEFVVKLYGKQVEGGRVAPL